MNAPRMVMCKKLGKELPGLPFKPFPNELGQEIFENVSMEAWQLWIKESPRYINTYRIDLQSEQGQEFLRQQMRIYFGFVDGVLPETAFTPREEP